MGFTDLNNGGNSSSGGNNTSIIKPTIGFGGLAVQTLRPVAQADFVYGINDLLFQTSSFAQSSISSADGLGLLNCGTDVSGSAILRIRRGIKYRPGQGSIMRGTAIFDTPIENNLQLIGAGNTESGYYFGYYGTQFGIIHKETGLAEVRRLEITTGATDNEEVTLTLDGDDYTFNIEIEGTTSTSQTAYKLLRQNYADVGKTGFVSDTIGSYIYFIAGNCNPTLTGSYAITGNGTIAGTFTRVQVGNQPTETFIPTSSFNIDRLDGNGVSGMNINPQKGNVYEIDFQYLGFGNARFAVEDPETGRFIDCHMIKNANNRTTPVLKNPNVQVRLECVNRGNSTNKTLKSASLAGYIAGKVNKLDPKFSESFPITDLKQTTFHPLALIKANRIHTGQLCFGEFDILRLAGSNETASKTLSIALFVGAEVTGPVDYIDVLPTQSIVSIATLNPNGNTPPNTISNLANIAPIHTLVIGAESSTSYDLDSLELIFSAGYPLLIAVKASSSPITGEVSINWFEQQ